MILVSQLFLTKEFVSDQKTNTKNDLNKKSKCQNPNVKPNPKSKTLNFDIEL